MATLAQAVLIDLLEPAVKPGLPKALTQRASPLKKAWDLRVKAAEQTRAHLIAARRAKAAELGQRKEAPAFPSAALLAGLIEKMQEAEVRREVELDAIRFKGREMAKPKAKPVVDGEAAAAVLKTKLFLAKMRRGALLEAKAAKAAEKPPKSPEKPASPAKPLAERLSAASERRAALLLTKVAKAAAYGAPRPSMPPAPPSLLQEKLAARLAAAGERHDSFINEKQKKAAAHGSEAVLAKELVRTVADAAKQSQAAKAHKEKLEAAGKRRDAHLEDVRRKGSLRGELVEKAAAARAQTAE